MEQKRKNLIWGIILILLGGFYLLQTTGIIPQLSPQIWAGIFAVFSLIFLATYLVSGWEMWGWLFPTCIFAGLAGVMLLIDQGDGGTWIGGLFMVTVALPFWFAFLLSPRTHRWALIPGWVLSVIAVVILFRNALSEELMGSLILFGTGLPFITVYLFDRTRWWGLIPGIILCGLGSLMLFVNQTSSIWIGMFMLFVISLPFLFVFSQMPRQWWAIIPGGILLTLAIVTLLTGIVAESWLILFMPLVSFWGMATPFIYLYLRREQYETEWARYPAAILLLSGITGPFINEAPGGMAAVILIGIGIWLLLDARRQPKLKG